MDVVPSKDLIVLSDVGDSQETKFEPEQEHEQEQEQEQEQEHEQDNEELDQDSIDDQDQDMVDAEGSSGRILRIKGEFFCDSMLFFCIDAYSLFTSNATPTVCTTERRTTKEDSATTETHYRDPLGRF